MDQVTIYDPQKGNEKAEFKFTQEIRFLILKFEYRNAVLSRGTWFKGFDLNLVLKRTYINTCEPQNNSKEQKPKFFPALPGYSGYRAGYSGPHCPECPGAALGLKNLELPGVSGHIPGVSGYPFAQRLFLG